MAKALLINGSPNSNGCTFTALKEVADTLEKEGIETEIIQIGRDAIRGCIACGYCSSHDGCVFDDMVNKVRPKLAEADALIVGSPVYYGSPNGNLISFLDRLFYSKGKTDLRMKVGASVVTCRRGGNTASFDVLNKYFTISQMPVASSNYWNNVHGFTAEDVLKDKEGLQTMRVLARNIAFLVRSISLGKEHFGLPEVEAVREFTSFPDGK
ncbi:MAG: flavodoxin family protein [Oscillospiraceae bacterium]|nr:flavodoxin family protein [Oscillospiraceae bacterium]